MILDIKHTYAQLSQTALYNQSSTSTVHDVLIDWAQCCFFVQPLLYPGIPAEDRSVNIYHTNEH